MIVTYAKSRHGDIYPYFICAGRHRNGKSKKDCDMKAILIDEVEAQVEQIDVTKEGFVQLVPRVGDHLLILGTVDKVEEKLDRLMNFYHNGLENIGWNKYRSISVAYENQVVCKKR